MFTEVIQIILCFIDSVLIINSEQDEIVIHLLKSFWSKLHQKTNKNNEEKM